MISNSYGAVKAEGFFLTLTVHLTSASLTRERWDIRDGPTSKKRHHRHIGSNVAVVFVIVVDVVEACD